MNSNDLDASIERGLEFLRRSQLPSGEFKILMSADKKLERDSVLDSSLFPTAFIVYSLGFADPAAAGAMIDKSLRFFLAETEGSGLWRYWTKQHPYYSTIPPDLDDIACISYVLRHHGVSFPANRELIFANRNAQGLFYTWMTLRWPLPPDASFRRVVLRQLAHPLKFYFFWKLNESKRHDVDCVVNANVLFYVGESPETRAVIDYLIRIVQRNEEGCCDKWHHNRYTFYYTVSRNYHAGMSGFDAVRDTLTGRIVEGIQDDGAVNDNALDTALAACSLLNWRTAPRELGRTIRFLLATQRDGGEWPAIPFYYAGPTNPAGFGSEELTTGFCLEALLRYRRTCS